MSFLSPVLLFGIALIGLPIALHLAMRRQPVRMVFPAMRLLKKRQHQNETRLQLQRWLLLALRCAAVGLLALALARPVLRPPQAEGSIVDGGSVGPAGVGTALGLVFDNALNAEYRQANRSRLEVALETADWLLQQAPADARVVVASRGQGTRATEEDRDSASLRLGRLTTTAATRPLGIAVRDGLDRLAKTPAAGRELYVFTDLSAGAWSNETQETVAAALDRHEGMSLRLVDVGVTQPQNISVGPLRLSSERLVSGEPLRLATTLYSTGYSTGKSRESVAVELWLDKEKGAEKRAERRVDFSSEDKGTTLNKTTIDFVLSGLEEGFHSGYVRVIAGDAAPADDRRYFALETRPPPALLLIAPRKEDALFLREAVDPSLNEPGVTSRFATSTVRFDEIDRARFTDHSAVLLLDPPPLSAKIWRRLTDYATAGGSVGVLLGRQATLDGMNIAEAQALLPATLRWRSREETYLRPTRYTHPAIALLADYAEAIPWRAFPVFQRWELDSVREGAAVVATYADGGPAIVEHAIGRGRVLMMTTPLSDRINSGHDSKKPWNLLPTGEDPWPFILLADSLSSYLTGWQAAPLNYQAGDTVTAPLPLRANLTGFVLRTPQGESLRQSIPPGATDLTIGLADTPGNYTITAGSHNSRLDRQFAVNTDPLVGQLDRIDFADLQNALGEDRVTLVRDKEELSRSIDLGRVGQELYGWILLAVTAAFAAEGVMSNRFYRADTTNEN